MWPVVAALQSVGHTVLAPTLPGHGGQPDDLRGATWAQWLDMVTSWPADVIVGQSMGASLALAAASRQACSKVVAINPLAGDIDSLEGLQWRLDRGHEWVEVEPSTVGEITLDRLPLSVLIEMMQGINDIDLSAVCVPVLCMTSKHDDVVDPANSDIVAAALAGPVTRVVLHNGGHVATLDADQAVLLESIVAFVGL